MGFVRTPEELARFEEVLTNVEFVGGEMLAVSVLIDPAEAARLLPPPLVPAEQPRVSVVIGRWRSNCVGDFGGGAVYVAARHGDVEADYVLTMFMDDDIPLLFGRDIYGEPKKLARCGLYRQGRRVSGFIERGGTRIIEIDADLPGDGATGESVGRNFNVKAMLAADGRGLHGDPVLTLATFETTTTLHWTGSAQLALRGTAHDPLDEIKPVEMIGARYTEADMRADCRDLAVMDPVAYLPYALGRYDDWTQLSTGTMRS